MKIKAPYIAAIFLFFITIDVKGQSENTNFQDSIFCCQKKHFSRAGATVLAVNILPWYFNRHVADDATAVLSLSSWETNIKQGFEWDPNSFKTNMFQHPFHGNLYFNAARSNGYDFWESVPFAFAGSAIWELFGEKNRGAINDWANTSLGGIAIGEALHRTAIMVRDNRMRGPKRGWKEFAAFFIDPAGSFNRIVRGDASRVGPNPDGRIPDYLQTSATLGYRSISEGRFEGVPTSAAYAVYNLTYGNPFVDYDEPFESFVLNVQINGKDKSTVGMLQVHGVLSGSEINSTEKSSHVFTIDQMFDYANNQTYEIGGQSYAFSIRSQWDLSERISIQSLVQPSIFVISAVVSEYVDIVQRDYDFGSGLGFRFMGHIVRDQSRILTVGYRGIFTHTLNGAIGNQIVHFALVKFRIPVSKSIFVGADYLLNLRDSYYRDFEDIHRRNAEFRLGITYAFTN